MKNIDTIYTIGHSTRAIDEFLELLSEFEIEVLVDVRRYPGSRKFPHFNQEALQETIENNGIEYHHIEGLGGRRKVHKDSKNIRWRLDSFRGYADYMETDEFTEGVQLLQDIALQKTTAYMCSEVVWWSCHRSMISDDLKAKGWEVIHIMGLKNAQEHLYTSAAIIENGKVSYEEKSNL